MSTLRVDNLQTTNLETTVNIAELYGFAQELEDKVSSVVLISDLESYNGSEVVLYVQEEGKEGFFYLSSSDMTSQVSDDIGQGVYVPANSDATGASGAWVRRVGSEINSRWYSFGTSGSDNRTIAEQACAHAEEFDASVVFHGESVYPMTVQRPPSIKGKLVAAEGFSLAYNQYLLDVRGDGVELDIELDLSGLVVSGVQVQNRCKGSVYVHNQGAGLQSEAGLQNCLYIAGTGNEFESVKIRDQADGVDTNASIPRCVATEDNNTIQYLEMVDANSGVISGGNGVTFGEIYANNVRDNPIYCLGMEGESTFWHIGSMTCVDCPDEPIVVSHGGYCTVGSLSLYNSGRVNVQGSTLLIGSMFVNQESEFLPDGRRAGTIFGVRARQEGDPDYSRLHVGTLSGSVYMTDTQAGACIYGVAQDERCEFTFGSISLRITMVSDASAYIMDSVRGSVNGGDMNLHIIDPDGVATTQAKFIRWVPQENADGLSSVSSLQITNDTSAEVRVQYLVGNPYVSYIPAGLQVSNNIGPYVTFPGLRAGNVKRPRLIMQMSAAPTIGNYLRGDVAFNQFPSSSGKAGWICIADGSPGTWKPFGAIDA